MFTLLLAAFLPFPSTSYFNFYCNRMSLCSHLHRRSIHFFLLKFRLFLNNTHVLVGFIGQTSVDVKQIEILMTTQNIFLVNSHF